MEKLQKYFDMLGFPAEDKITGFKGVISSVGFDLYGCIQVVITPRGVDDKGQLIGGNWFDVNRVTITDKKRVMAAPSFTRVDSSTQTPTGAAAKPAMPSSRA